MQHDFFQLTTRVWVRARPGILWWWVGIERVKHHEVLGTIVSITRCCANRTPAVCSKVQKHEAPATPFSCWPVGLEQLTPMSPTRPGHKQLDVPVPRLTKAAYDSSWFSFCLKLLRAFREFGCSQYLPCESTPSLSGYPSKLFASANQPASASQLRCFFETAKQGICLCCRVKCIPANTVLLPSMGRWAFRRTSCTTIPRFSCLNQLAEVFCRIWYWSSSTFTATLHTTKTRLGQWPA